MITVGMAGLFAKAASVTPPTPGASTWDASQKGPNIVLSSGDNLATYAGGGTYNGVLGTLGSDTGKKYFEVLLTDHSSSPYAQIGLSISLAPTYVGSFAGGYAYYQQTGEKYNSSTPTAYGAAFVASGAVIGVGYDASNGQIEFFKDGVSQGIAFTVTPGTKLYPAFSPWMTGGKGLLRSVAADITTLPSGYSAWAP